MKREFFSTNEVAELLGISPFTIRRYIQFRKLKAVKLEGSYRVRRTDLDRFLQAREIETEEELGEEEDKASERIAVPRRPGSSAKTEPSTRQTKRIPSRPQTRSERAKSVRKTTGRE